MKLDPDQKLVEEIRQLRQQGKTHAEILRRLAVVHHLSPTEMMVQLAATFGLQMSDTFCIGGWWHDGSGELKDEQINEMLEREIVAREKERAA